MIATLMIIGVLVIVVIGSIVNGLVLVQLWGWFITPFFQIPIPTVAQAIGIAMVISFLTQSSDYQEKSSEEKIKTILNFILRPVLTLIIGWIVYQFTL